MTEFLIKNGWSIISLAGGLIVTIVTIYVTLRKTMEFLVKDVSVIKKDLSTLKSKTQQKDQEHDIKFAHMEGEIKLLKAEQKNLREYAINGINEVKDAIAGLRELFIKSMN